MYELVQRDATQFESLFGPYCHGEIDKLAQVAQEGTPPAELSPDRLGANVWVLRMLQRCFALQVCEGQLRPALYAALLRAFGDARVVVGAAEAMLRDMRGREEDGSAPYVHGRWALACSPKQLVPALTRIQAQAERVMEGLLRSALALLARGGDTSFREFV